MFRGMLSVNVRREVQFFDVDGSSYVLEMRYAYVCFEEFCGSLQDVCLPAPSLFEENLLSVLNSYLFFNRVDIVSMLQVFILPLLNFTGPLIFLTAWEIFLWHYVLIAFNAMHLLDVACFIAIVAMQLMCSIC